MDMLKNKIGLNSNVKPIKSVILKHPKDSFISKSNIDKFWKQLNFLEKPDFTKAIKEYEVRERRFGKTGEQITINNGKPGDYLILTKPIGSGIITTASKEKNISESILKNTIKYMTQLNHDASHIMTSLKANACVDISGFGLTGHILEILNASNLSAIIDSSKIPTIKGVFDLAKKDNIPGGTLNNFQYLKNFTDFSSKTTRLDHLLVSDAQTSGGLLVSLPPDEANRFINSCRQDASIIGEFKKQVSPLIRLSL